MSLARKKFRVVITDDCSLPAQIATSISISVPDGLTRQQAVAYVTGHVATQLEKFAAWEAFGISYISRHRLG